MSHSTLRGSLATLALAVLCLAPALSWAQDTLVPINPAGRIIGPINSNSPILGSDVAWDPVNQVFLVVRACYNAGTCPAGLGQVYGLFTNTSGAVVGGPFSIEGPGEGNFPRARFSADLNSGQGGFLVAWAEEVDGVINGIPAKVNRIQTKTVAYGGGAGVVLGPVNTINDSTSYAWIAAAPAIGYSPVSQRFLVAWRTFPHQNVGGSAPHLASVLVDLTGAPVTSVVRLSSALGRDPGVAWDSDTNKFGVSFTAENAAGTYGYAAFAVVSPLDGTFSRQSFPAIVGFGYISDVDYNPDTQRFVMTWHQRLRPGGPEVRVAEIASDLTIVTEGLITRRWPGYDALSIARNPVSATFAVVSMADDALGTDDLAGVELNRRGYRISNLSLLAGGVTVRYPRVGAAHNLPSWGSVFSDDYEFLNLVVFQTTSTAGGAPGEYGAGGLPPPPPPPPPPTPGGCTTPQPDVTWTCVNGNWLPPSSTPPPGGCTTPQPDPAWTCSNGNWIPPSNTPPPSPGGCTTVQPGANWTCVNGNWLPPSSTPPPPGGCTTPQPDPTWTCSNGNWIPPSSAPPPSPGGCTTVQPGANWTCVNGNWLPPSSTPPPPTGGCTTPQPDPAWTCSNGNWLPPGSTPPSNNGSCTTPQPGPTWTCSNGNWLPPGSTPPSPGGCTTIQPGPLWICVNGNWLPPGEPAAFEPPGSADDLPPGPNHGVDAFDHFRGVALVASSARR